MHTDRKTGKIGYQDKPTVAVRLVCTVLPFQYQPENHCREKAGVSIYLALYSTEPECITPGIGQCAYYARTHNGYQFTESHLLIVWTNQFLSQARHTPEQEHDASRTHQRAHRVHHTGYLRRIAHKLAEQIGCQHKKWCAGRMSDLQLIPCSNKLGTIPKTGSRFYGRAISKCRYQERQPAHQIVNLVVLFHLLTIYSSLNSE